MTAHLDKWSKVFERYVLSHPAGEPAHDLNHVRRVVSNALRLAVEEGARLEVVYAASWLHDCVVVSKDSPDRVQASRLAADQAVEFLKTVEYPSELAAIHHAIVAHAFSASVSAHTIEAKVVQDADRLDALGAVGIARCIMVGTALGNRLYDPSDPFCRSRKADDQKSMIDHFYTKLLGLVLTMNTETGKREARERTDFMLGYLDQLESEIAGDF
jgi:uncharacterized protein